MHAYSQNGMVSKNEKEWYRYALTLKKLEMEPLVFIGK